MCQAQGWALGGALGPHTDSSQVLRQQSIQSMSLSRSVSSMLLSKLGMADADVLSYMLLKRQAIFFQPSPPKSEKSVKGWQESVHW